VRDSARLTSAHVSFGNAGERKANKNRKYGHLAKFDFAQRLHDVFREYEGEIVPAKLRDILRGGFRRTCGKLRPSPGARQIDRQDAEHHAMVVITSK